MKMNNSSMIFTVNPENSGAIGSLPRRQFVLEAYESVSHLAFFLMIHLTEMGEELGAGCYSSELMYPNVGSSQFRLPKEFPAEVWSSAHTINLMCMEDFQVWAQGPLDNLCGSIDPSLFGINPAND